MHYPCHTRHPCFLRKLARVECYDFSLLQRDVCRSANSRKIRHVSSLQACDGLFHFCNDVSSALAFLCNVAERLLKDHRLVFTEWNSEQLRVRRLFVVRRHALDCILQAINLETPFKRKRQCVPAKVYTTGPNGNMSCLIKSSLRVSAVSAVSVRPILESFAAAAIE